MAVCRAHVRRGSGVAEQMAAALSAIGRRDSVTNWLDRAARNR